MLTPLEIETKNFKKTALGYSINEVNEFVKKLLKDYELLYKENIELKDKISVLNDGIQYYKTIETTLQNTLITAEKAADETKAAAYKKADALEKEAENTAKEILRKAKEKAFNINQKIDLLYKQHDSIKLQMKHFYQSQLDIINKHSVNLINDFDDNEEISITQIEDGE